MAKKRITKVREPVRMRFKRLENGNRSIYFDIYRDGIRKYEFPKLYLVPETSDAGKEQNRKTLEAANRIKAQMILDFDSSVPGFKNENSEKQKETLTKYKKGIGFVDNLF